jgi:hypothetical protein
MPLSRLLLFLSQAGRRVEDREFDLDEALRRDIVAKMTGAAAPEALVKVVRDYVPFDQAASAALFGESLPPGLVLSALG